MLARNFMTPRTKNALYIIAAVFLLCLGLMLIINYNRTGRFEGFGDRYQEGFDAMAEFEQQVAGLPEEERRSLLTAMRDRLVHYGLLPNHGDQEVDRTQWVPKSNIPPAGPRIDMSQYVRKSSIPPEKECPPPAEIDRTQYVKKSTLPPAQKCPPNIAPKVQVSAGLCTKCPECPKCPPPQRCPEVKCPSPPACPPPPKCPEMKCPPEKKCPECSRIKYIKVPTVITRTVYKDKDGNVTGEEVKHDDRAPPKVDIGGLVNSIKQIVKKVNTDKPPKPVTEPEENMEVAKDAREANECKSTSCRAVGLNSAFREYGVYGF